MSDTQTTEAARIVHKIFELDAKYQGGKITARDRADFIRKFLNPLLASALKESYDRGYADGCQTAY